MLLRIPGHRPTDFAMDDVATGRKARALMVDQNHLQILNNGGRTAVEQWLGLNEQTQFDLSGAGLADRDFSGWNLARVNFANATLERVNFSGCVLTRATL